MAFDYNVYGEMMNNTVDFYRGVLSNNVIFALLAGIIGIIFANEFGKLATRLLREMGVDKFIEKSGMRDFLKRGGFRFSISGLVGWIVKWFIMLFFISVAVEALNLPVVSDFLLRAIGYIPNLVGALAILTIGAMISQMVYEALEGASSASQMRIYHLAAVVARFVIMVVTALVVLDQVGIDTSILQIFAGGFSMMLALAGGLAFGLGGKDLAHDILEEVRGKLK